MADHQDRSRPPRQQRVSDSRQRPLFDVRQFRSQPYQPWSFFGVLERFGELVIRRDDFPEPAHTGAPSWCKVLLSKLVLIQRKHGWTDRETVDRATHDLRVKACLGLGVEQEGPSQPKLCEHRALMMRLGVLERYERRFVKLVEMLGLLERDEPALIDSVPVRGAGQVLDAYNLLGAAIRRGLKRLARVSGEAEQEVAERLGLEAFLGRSVKGRFEVDWEDAGSRRAFLAELEAAAERLLAAIDATLARPGEAGEGEEAGESSVEGDDEPEDASDDDDDGGGTALAESATVLRDILAREVERDDEGEVAGLVKRTADDRIISVTDPDMRHGRKSASVLIRGYKAQIVASLVFGWILLARVFRANGHDGRDLPALVAALDERHALRPEWLAGDHAYGTLANHAAFAADNGPELIARMPRPSNGGRFTKDEFDVDFASATLTCPTGHRQPRSRFATQRGRKGWLFEFPYGVCQACPRMSDCVSPKACNKGRSVFVVPTEERLIRAHLASRQQPDFRAKLSERVHVERTISGFAQCGGKRLRRFQQERAEFDVRISALAHNLRRLGAVLRDRPELVERLMRLVVAARRDDRATERPTPFFALPPATAPRASVAAIVLLALITRALAPRARPRVWRAVHYPARSQ